MSGENTLYATICVPCKGSGRVTFIDGERKCFNCGGKGWIYVDNPEKRSDKMKLSEVIKELEIDDTKIFVSKNQLLFGEMRCQSAEGIIAFSVDNSMYTGGINIEREWEEIKQLLTFEEILNNGKLFKCKHPKIKESSYWTLSRFISMLYRECFDSAEIIDIFKNGKFYN